MSILLHLLGGYVKLTLFPLTSNALMFYSLLPCCQHWLGTGDSCRTWVLKSDPQGQNLALLMGFFINITHSENNWERDIGHPHPLGWSVFLCLRDCVPKCVHGCLRAGLHLPCVGVWQSEWDLSAETTGETINTARRCVWLQPSILMCREMVWEAGGEEPGESGCMPSIAPTPHRCRLSLSFLWYVTR